LIPAFRMNHARKSERPDVLHWINGDSVAGSSGTSFDDLNPENDSLIASVVRGDHADVRSAVNAAAESFEPYARLGPSAREGMLLRAADLLQRDAEDFRNLLVDEIGSPVAKANLEISIATRVLKANAGMARQMTGRTYASDVPGSTAGRGRWSIGFRRPLGVVGGITPFNVPLIKGIKHSSMPLALGNTFVWLPSPETPKIAQRIASMYAEAGFPAGAFNVVHGFGHEIGDTLTADPRVRAVGFTGSVPVGRQVQANCGKHGKRVTLELGGQNALVILADADLQAAVAAAVRGGFVYQGQICMASSRVIVEKPLFASFLERFVAAAQSLSLGDLREPTTMIGPIINSQSRARIRSLLEDAVSRGVEVHCGNRWQDNRLQPTVLTGIRDEMKLAREEVFGPVVGVQVAEDSEHAIELANRCPSMLAAAVFTRDLDRALRFSETLNTAMVHVNDMTIQQEPEVPFGGDGDSGFGREGMQTGVEDYTSWRWVTIKHSG
jgi:acyl-CoA reductase-like NAD-dependent aldehyde dehydrogenase